MYRGGKPYDFCVSVFVLYIVSRSSCIAIHMCGMCCRYLCFSHSNIVLASMWFRRFGFSFELAYLKTIHIWHSIVALRYDRIISYIEFFVFWFVFFFVVDIIQTTRAISLFIIFECELNSIFYCRNIIKLFQERKQKILRVKGCRESLAWFSVIIATCAH